MSENSSNSSGPIANLPKNKKIIVLDTSAIFYDPNLLNAFSGVHFIVPSIVITELNEQKNESSKIFLNNFNEIIEGKNGSKVISFGKNSISIVFPNGDVGEKEKANYFFKDSTIKNDILDVCTIFIKKGYKNVLLYTTDIGLKAKAGALNIPLNKSHEIKTKNFSCATEIFLDKKLDAKTLEGEKTFSIKLIQEKTVLVDENYYFINYNDEGKEKRFVLKYNSRKKLLQKVFTPNECFSIHPKNVDQAITLSVLLDKNISLVAITGASGSGKTLIALAAGNKMYGELQFKKIMLSKPIVTVGKDLGFFPGDPKEKIMPHLQNFFDNISVIENSVEHHKGADKKSFFKETLKKLKKPNGIDEKDLIIEAVQLLRGRSILDTFYIIDEVQNLTPHEVKTIITRAGENTKIILCGDINQIDTPYLDKHNNGLSFVIERFKNCEIFTHIHLPESVRSPLAKLADKLL